MQERYADLPFPSWKQEIKFPWENCLPCTGGKKGRLKSINILNKAGFKNITEIHYEKMRHEILNEKDHCTVENDIINFLNN